MIVIWKCLRKYKFRNTMIDPPLLSSDHCVLYLKLYAIESDLLSSHNISNGIN